MTVKNYRLELTVEVAKAWAKRLRQWRHQTGDYYEKASAFAGAVLPGTEHSLYCRAIETKYTESFMTKLHISPASALEELPHREAVSILIIFAELLEAFVAREETKEKTDAKAD